jgi:hypothetical protein
MHRRVAVALLAALALGVASCGGESTLTRAELVRQIEVACKQAEKVSEKASRQTKSSTSASQFLTAVLAGQRAIANRLEDLDPSDAAKADFEAFKRGVQQRVRLFTGVASAGGAELQRGMRATQKQGEVLTSRIQSAADRLGVDGCI